MPVSVVVGVRVRWVIEAKRLKRAFVIEAIECPDRRGGTIVPLHLGM